LKELAMNGTIHGVKDPNSKRGDWIFDKRSLDEYRESQMAEHLIIKEEAKKILASL
jgi:hypothetical protein